ncbi:MAG TPA: AAA family ATPase [Xanthomarina sp.]|nr:AAA family ATPase [Xanthomarina sp.]
MALINSTLKSKNAPLTLDKLHLKSENRSRINQLIEEFNYIDALNNLNIPVDNKILLHGHTGCGKTATAHAIGIELNKKVITLNLSGFVSSRLGETAKNLSDIFKSASNDKAILFIDEFDFIGKIRDYDNKDSGEIKRLVNALIQQIDNLSGTSLLICATNHIDIIDSALLRRFQIKLEYQLPTKEALDAYYDTLLASFPKNLNTINRSYGISFAEAKDRTYQQIKAHVIKLEKQRKHLLFSYGSLKSKQVQLEHFGRELKGTADSLSGYKLTDLEIKDTTVIKIDKTDILSIASKSREVTDKIEGLVLEITGEELVQIDKFGLSNYKRIKETTNSGAEVWVYVAHNSY